MPDDPSCAELLGKIYNGANNVSTGEDSTTGTGVWFEDGWIAMGHPELGKRIASAKGIAQVENRGDFAAVRKLVARQQNHELLVTWSASGRFDASVLSQRPRTIEILSAIPTNQAAFDRVFDTNTPVHPDVLAGYKRRVDKLMGRGPRFRSENLQDVTPAAGAKLADHVRARLAAQSTDGLLMIPAHIDASGMVRLQDGSAIPVRELKGLGQVWILGCDAVEHKGVDIKTGGDLLVTAGTPDIDHVLDATRKLAQSFASSTNGTYADAMRHAHAQRYEFLMPLTGVAVLLKYLDEEDE